MVGNASVIWLGLLLLAAAIFFAALMQARRIPPH
jgi:hypothetical protein